MSIKNKKVKIIGKRSVFIDKDVVIGDNVVIYQNNIIKGKTIIGDNVTLGPGNYISNSILQNNCSIEFSYIQDSEVGSKSQVGPFSRIRLKSKIGEGAKIGNFVEVKNSTIGAGSKASHLAYIGDADIGKKCNIGCGAIFVNYNGKQKFRSKVGDNCFIGSNVNIIAPVDVAKSSYICAGSTLTQNTQPFDFVIARSKEVIKPKYAKKYFNRGE